MEVGKTPVIVVDTGGLKLDGFFVMSEGIVEFPVLKERKTQVIVGWWSIWSHFDCILEIIDGGFQFTESSKGYSFVEVCLILILWLRKSF